LGQKVARRILNIFAEPFTIEQQELYISASIGIALFPTDGENADELLKSADVAMYHAKKLGRNNYQYYSRKLNEEAVRKLMIEGKLRRAVENKALELYYQPQIDTATGRITGVEALLRWHDQEIGQVSPTVFVPIAEEYGLVVPISEWVIREACRQAYVWNAAYDESIDISINVSGIHFNNQGLEQVIAGALKENGLDPRHLELELTETAILQDPSLAIKTLQTLKDMGVQISLDDFGTGYSSLSYLMKLPIDKLKIDQSFIRNLEQGTDGSAIVSAVIAMAHSLGLRVIAEGVEEAVQLQILREMQCDLVQGYYVARPMPADEFERLIVHGLERRA
jgi:EAL domain-containing protein (putative c-di-GMP-specific phosphodiesterase class I)